MKDLSQALRALGFTESDARTYFAALENGPGTVIDFAAATGLSRQTIYLAIESLAKKGLMADVAFGKKNIYAAERPEKLLAYAHRQEAEFASHMHDLEEALPELELKANGEKPIVKLFEGKEGIRTILEDMLRSEGSAFEEMADLDAMKAVFPIEENRDMMEQLAKIKPQFRAIYAGSTEGKQIRSDRKFLPTELGGFHSSMTIYDKKIALVTFEGRLPSMLIESAPLAKLFRTLFLLAYRQAGADANKNDPRPDGTRV